jgi:signal transduction histidine kinase
LGEFAASIAHEVNQPITAMHMNANTALRWLTGIKEDCESLVEAREALQHIVRDGLRASEIVARIRELFKKVEPVKRPLDLNEAIREIVIMTRNELDKKQINIVMKLGADLPQVLGDRVQLQQVILNLTLNSIEAMSNLEGLREMTVSTHVNTDKEVLVRISDTGPGIATENIENIFEAFHTTKPGGLGMGLSISRSIVESHSGHLWCSINDGPGVSFNFTVPIHREMKTSEGTTNT